MMICQYSHNLIGYRIVILFWIEAFLFVNLYLTMSNLSLKVMTYKSVSL